MPELTWTCKHLLEKECWRHIISKPCPYQALEGMMKCKEFQKGIVWGV